MLELKKHFPIFKNNPGLCYLDSAATSQKPQAVIDTIKRFYEYENANIHRGIYKLSEKATELYEETRKKIADFVNAQTEEIIFVKNATEGINLVSYSFGETLKSGDTVLISVLEHHANFVPWQMLKKRKNINLEIVDINEDGTLDMVDFENKLLKKPKLVSLTHVSNAIGTINDVETLIKRAHEAGAKVLIDGSQSVPHLKIDLKILDADFFVFTGHKCLGPTGIGVLFIKSEIAEIMEPFLTGGDMIESVSFEKTTFLPPQQRFEAGTPNIAGVVGLGAAIDYLQKIGMGKIREHEKELFKTAWEILKTIDGVRVYGPENPEQHAGIISFTLDNVHPHDIAQIFATDNIAIRAGHHCAEPLIAKLELPATARMSFYLYNDESDIEKAAKAIYKIKEIFK